MEPNHSVPDEAPPADAAGKLSKLKENIRREAKNFGGIFLYTWIFTSLFALHKAFLLEISPLSGQLLAIINAFVLGKVIVVLEFFRVGDVLHHRPPLFRVFIKSVIFGLLLLVFRMLEEGIRGLFQGKTFSQTLGGERLMELGTYTIIMVVALVPYFAFREVVRVIGAQKMLAILLRPTAIAST
ncbi:MAG TPA: hypothetical protein VL981_12220 [Candidatus Methylacidiphilales bacterium]|nr:hypothetical protein [Candidatus Methylacidiphilales bacterium]